jgi:hypothetical protein
MLRVLPDDRYIELRFEDLVQDPAQELVRITDFLGVAFEPAMIEDYPARSGAKFNGKLPRHHVHLAEKPSPAQSYKWMRQMSRIDQAIAYEIAGPLLADLGYPKGTAKHPLKVLGKAAH